MLTDGVQSPANIGGLLRLLDAFGIDQLLLANADFNSNSGRLRRTARNTLKTVAVTEYSHADQALDALTKQFPKHKLVLLEITDHSRPISELQLNTEEQNILVLGSEVHGISKEILDKYKEAYHLPMYGNNSSMNVTQAAAIALYHMTQQLL